MKHTIIQVLTCSAKNGEKVSILRSLGLKLGEVKNLLDSTKGLSYMEVAEVISKKY